MSGGSRVAIVRRLFITKLPKVPWAIGQKESPVVLKPCADFNTAISRSQISEGFKFAYSSLISALGSHDYASLQEFLEGRLYKTVEIQLKALESQGFRMQVVNPEEKVVVEPEIHNVGMHVGVHLQRIENLPKEDYIKIKNLKLFSSLIPTMKVKPGDKISVADFLGEGLSNHWFYNRASMPLHIVLVVDAVYKGETPLTITRKSKGKVYTEKIEEVHVIRFESMIDDANWKQSSFGMRVIKIFMKLLRKKVNLLELQWKIADIDNIMEGNPFVVSKKKLKR